MYQSDRGSYRKQESAGKAFRRSCFGRMLMLLIVVIAVLTVAYFTAPTKEQMTAEMNDNIMQCMEMNDSIRGDKIDDFVHNIGFIFTQADSTEAGMEWREAFDKYNRMEIYRHTFFTTAYIYNNIKTEGTRVGIGAFGIVVPTANFNDFLLRVGPMHKGYDQKLIRTTTAPADLGHNPGVDVFHYNRNPDN